ncbi:uncharacterized protein [Apostichopus japonicus]|uniref:uncharacterized protein isoform X5 n=1 Tax=Stichopus japonicus TaxID=307972 RepID=UPI003AB74D17
MAAQRVLDQVQLVHVQNRSTIASIQRRKDVLKARSPSHEGDEDDVEHTPVQFRQVLPTVRDYRSPTIQVPFYNNVLPNAYLMESTNLTEYRSSTVAFVHNPKSGGTTVKDCMLQMSTQLGQRHPLLLTTANRHKIQADFMNGLLNAEDHRMLVGTSSFGIGESFSTRKCSYFTIVREPYDRMISHYFFCQNGGETGRPCHNKTIEEYAIQTGSILFHQMAVRITCRCQDDCNDLSLHPWTCKRDHKMVNLLQSRKEIIDLLQQHLETDFAIIGLTEEFDITLRILQQAFGLPFYDQCRHLKNNAGTYGNVDEVKLDKLKLEARQTLVQSKRVRDILEPDVILYQRMKEIFTKQKEMFLLKHPL